MNRHVERVALRARSSIMARRRPRPSVIRRAWSARWWLRPLVLVVVVPLVVLRWMAAQVVGFGLVLAGWSPPLTLAGLDALATVESGIVPSVATVPAGGAHVGDDVAARHRLLDRVEAIQAREAAQAQGYYYTPRRRFRQLRAVRAVAVTAAVVWVLWWFSLFSVGMAKGIGANANGPHGVQLPGATTAASR